MATFWFVVGNGQIRRSMDGGVNWTVFPVPADYGCGLAIWGLNPSNFWVAGLDTDGYNSIWYNNGSWTKQYTDYYASSPFTDLWGRGSDIYASRVASYITGGGFPVVYKLETSTWIPYNYVVPQGGETSQISCGIWGGADYLYGAVDWNVRSRFDVLTINTSGGWTFDHSFDANALDCQQHRAVFGDASGFCYLVSRRATTGSDHIVGGTLGIWCNILDIPSTHSVLNTVGSARLNGLWIGTDGKMFLGVINNVTATAELLHYNGVGWYYFPLTGTCDNCFGCWGIDSNNVMMCLNQINKIIWWNGSVPSSIDVQAGGLSAIYYDVWGAITSNAVYEISENLVVHDTLAVSQTFPPYWWVVSGWEVGAYYLESAVEGERFSLFFDKPRLPISVPHRIAGIGINAIIRGNTGAMANILLIENQTEWVDNLALEPGGTWASFRKFYSYNPFNGKPWKGVDLYNLEIGLQNGANILIDCAVLEVSVIVEEMPYCSLNFVDDGYYGSWLISSPDLIPHLAVNNRDGDRSYISSVTTNEKSSFQLKDLVIPSNFHIDGLALTIQHWGEFTSVFAPLTRINAIEWLGPCGTESIGPREDGQLVVERIYYGEDLVGGAGRWKVDDLLASEWGVKNLLNKSVKVSGLQIEVFASLIPETTVRLLPRSPGTVNQWVTEFPGDGELAYEDVNTYYIYDGSCIMGDAESSYHGTRIITFVISNVLNVTWYGLRWVARVARHPSSLGTAIIAPVLKFKGETWVGRSFNIDSLEFMNVSEMYWMNPFNSWPWIADDLLHGHLEIGIAILANSCRCSHIYVEGGVIPPRISSDLETIDCEFTTTGEAYIAQCTIDHIVWVIDRFDVGRGGFDIDNPQTILPVEPGDDELQDPIYIGIVDKTHFEGKTAYFWCCIPPDVLSDPIGEIMLMARILSSDDPVTYVVDSYFPMAVAHFPAGFHALKSIRAIKLSLTFG